MSEEGQSSNNPMTESEPASEQVNEQLNLTMSLPEKVATI